MTVPETEGDYPHTSTGPSFAINPKDQLAVWAWWDVNENKTRAIFPLRLGGCDSLHFVHQNVLFFPWRGRFCMTISQLTEIKQGLNIAFTGAGVLTSALILAFTYTACQDNRAGKATFIVISLPSTWIPPAMLFLTFVINGAEATKVQATGLVAAHLHDFLTKLYPTFGGGRSLLETPAFIQRIFANGMPSVVKRAYGTAINPAQQAPRGSTIGASTGGILPESWKSRGSGHRLGGD